MKILVANLGSTSFKYRLFDMADERVLARGGVERIGSAESKCFVEAGGQREDLTIQAKDRSETLSDGPGAVNFRDFVGSNKNRVGVNAACKFALVSIEERAALGVDWQSLLLLFTSALYQVVMLRNLQVNKADADGKHPEDNKRRNH